MFKIVSPRDLWTNPNLLTIYRIGAVPAIVLLLLSGNKILSFLAAIVFSLAAITDYLDGYFARTRGMVSNLGKFLDPLADKLLIVCSLIMLVAQHRIPGWMVCVIAGRELAVTGLRGIAAEQGIVIAAERLGKWKTGFQIGAIIPLLLHYSYFGFDLHRIGMITLWIALGLTIASGASYFKNFANLIKP
ncbi:MAG: CDP-diacylglycerol--glycerol-3-phosphate 3-phosphatidyltransferase [Thermodesulfobacteriota bacterium]